LAKISPADYRFPEPFAGVQVNFCKNIKCKAFGAPETLNRVRRPKGTSPETGDYIRTGDSRGNVRMLCGLCGSQNPLRSNEAIAQELGRLSAHIFDSSAPRCPTETCSSHVVPVTTPGFYARNGKTPSGTPRWPATRGWETQYSHCSCASGDWFSVSRCCRQCGMWASISAMNRSL